ncbi:MAG: ATP-binding protein [Deltaproteobacteria bacterium]|nr:ATP-binding protein [Deltaproteobacteria bacterium]
MDHLLNFQWLARLRWAAIFGQVTTVLLVRFGLNVAIPILPLFGVITFLVLFNLGIVPHLLTRTELQVRHVALGMILDMTVLTALLMLSGGAHNPFSSLYVIYIAFAAFVLPAGWQWGLVSLSVGYSAALFLVPSTVLEMPHVHGEHSTFGLHVQGMWIALAVAATLIVFFVIRIRRAMGLQAAALARARGDAERNERLSALATLAAGAAHELSTPLGTIALVSKELSLRLSRANAEVSVIADAGLIRSEVERCRQILEQMAANVGALSVDSSSGTQIGVAIGDVKARLGSDSSALVVETVADDMRWIVAVPHGPFVYALLNLIRNAIEASSESGRAAVLSVHRMEGDVLFEVRDHGQGMSPDALARVGEPFFTTKPAGKGMGLGLFVTRGTAEQVGGSLHLESQIGVGTVARLRLPLLPSESPS